MHTILRLSPAHLAVAAVSTAIAIVSVLVLAPVLAGETRYGMLETLAALIIASAIMIRYATPLLARLIAWGDRHRA